MITEPPAKDSHSIMTIRVLSLLLKDLSIVYYYPSFVIFMIRYPMESSHTYVGDVVHEEVCPFGTVFRTG